MRFIVEKRDKACLKAFLEKGMILEELPLINSFIGEIDERYIEELRTEGCDIRAVEETAVAAQLEKAKAAVRCINSDGLTGRNVTAAILDTGIGNIPDFSGRIKGFKDIVEGRDAPYDDNSHGSHVAGILGGSGRLSGIAPGVGIVSVKVLDRHGRGSSAELLKGLQWVYDNRKKYDIRIVNLSVGTGVRDSFDPLVAAVEALWDKGLVVITAAGNEGPKPGSVTSPGTSRKVITVGSSDDDRLCSIWDLNMKDFSGRGPTRECIVKPDILAPGAEIYSCSARGDYIPLSGTSMSTPIVSGAVALLIEKYPHITPNAVKYHIEATADSLNFPKNRQGSGLLNIERLLSLKPEFL